MNVDQLLQVTVPKMRIFYLKDKKINLVPKKQAVTERCLVKRDAVQSRVYCNLNEIHVHFEDKSSTLCKALHVISVIAKWDEVDTGVEKCSHHDKIRTIRKILHFNQQLWHPHYPVQCTCAGKIHEGPSDAPSGLVILYMQGTMQHFVDFWYLLPTELLHAKLSLRGR